MKRRDFIRSAGVLSLGSFVLNGIPVKGSPLPPAFSCQDVEGRVFVMINLFGANDTLNTVVPVEQYGLYANARPKIRIMDSGVHKYLELDKTLPLHQQTALHPVMTSFKELYDEGKLNIVHGVGYPNSNRSHFKSNDLWNTAGDSTPENFNFVSGWAGELFESRYPGVLGNPNASMPDPPCIEMGATSSSLLFQTSSDNNASVLLTNSDVSSYYSSMVGVGGPPPVNLPGGNYGVDIAYIYEIQKLSNTYAQRIQTIFNAGANSTVEYPDTAIASQLKTVARLIKGGAKSNMYTVHHNGYDTHGVQVVNGSSHLGIHANLLRDLSEAVKAFMDDIAALGIDDRVIITTHSEFGRTIDENAGMGTDHGGVSTMFVIGKGVRPGITGTPIDLTKTTTRALTDLQYDYRSVWAAVLQDFMGHGPQPMSAARMGAFTSSKAPVIADEYKVAASCYINGALDVEAGPLPVVVSDFLVRLLPSGRSKISWETRSESNCKEFVVEYSRDNERWATIGAIAGRGDSSVLQHYEMEHDSPSPGVNFYRLWQVSFDGDRQLHGPLQLTVNGGKGIEVKVYPNPAVKDINVAITTNQDQEMLLNIFDIQGHLLHRRQVQAIKGFNKINIPVSTFKRYKGEVMLQILKGNVVLLVTKVILQ